MDKGESPFGLTIRTNSFHNSNGNNTNSALGTSPGSPSFSHERKGTRCSTPDDSNSNSQSEEAIMLSEKFRLLRENGNAVCLEEASLFSKKIEDIKQTFNDLSDTIKAQSRTILLNDFQLKTIKCIEAVNTIFILTNTKRVKCKANSVKEKNIKILEHEIQNVKTISKSIFNTLDKIDWTKKNDYSLLTKQVEIFLNNINSILQSNGIQPLEVKYSIKNTFWKKEDKIKCAFLDPKMNEDWEKIKDKIASFLEKALLIKLQNNSKLISFEQLIKELLSKRNNFSADLTLLCLEREQLLDERKTLTKTDDIDHKIKCKELEIVFLYREIVLEVVSNFDNLPNIRESEIKPYQKILNSIIQIISTTNSSSNDHKIFLREIGSYIKTEFKSNLEKIFVNKVNLILKEWKDATGYQIFYDSIHDAFIKRIREEEAKNILLEWAREIKSGSILVKGIIEGKKYDLVPRLEFLKELERELEKISGEVNEEHKRKLETRIINRYLKKTEEEISKSLFEDQEGTILSNFREFVYGMLTANSYTTQNLFEDLKDLRDKIENNKTLNDNNTIIYDAISSYINEHYSNILKRLNRKEICIRLCAYFSSDSSQDSRLIFFDESGTLLENIKKNLPRIIQNQKEQKKEPDILAMNLTIFEAFISTMKALENNQKLDPASEGALNAIENELIKKNPEAIKKYGIKKIGIILFRLYRILKQQFSIGTLTELRAVFMYLLFNESVLFGNKGKDNPLYFNLEWEKNMKSEISVLTEPGKAWFLWKYMVALTKDNLFVQSVQIDLPSIAHKEIEDENQKSTHFYLSQGDENHKQDTEEVKIDFICNSAASIGEPKEILLYNRKIAMIALLLKAMEFPRNALKKLK